MAKRFSCEEDFFLIQYGPAVGFDHVASHDLGRPKGAGRRRADRLINSGAALAYCQAQIAMCRYHDALGDKICVTDNAHYWGNLADWYRKAVGKSVTEPVSIWEAVELRNKPECAPSDIPRSGG